MEIEFKVWNSVSTFSYYVSDEETRQLVFVLYRCVNIKTRYVKYQYCSCSFLDLGFQGQKDADPEHWILYYKGTPILRIPL